MSLSSWNRTPRLLCGFPARTLLISLPALLLACDRPPDIVAPAATPPLSAALAASDASVVQTANYYSAEVSLHFTGGESPGYTGDGPQRTRTYLLERSLPGSGVWETRTTYHSFNQFGDAGAPQIWRVETNDAGSYIRMYDRSGAMIVNSYVDSTGNKESYYPLSGRTSKTTKPMPIEPEVSASVSATSGVSGTDAASTAGSGSARSRGPQDRRAWLDEIFITPEASRRNMARLEAAFRRASAGGDQSVRRYERVDGQGRLQEVVVDNAIGAITEVRISSNGELRERIVYRYTRAGGDLAVRTGMRVEHRPPGAGSTPLVLEQTLRNVRLETQEVR